MRIERVVPNITSDRIAESLDFYTTVLGFEVAMDLGWIVTLASPNNPTAQISLLRGEPSGIQGQVVTLTIEVSDVDEIHASAVSCGHPIVHPLTNEPWGVRRFHMCDPNGVTINIMSHLG